MLTRVTELLSGQDDVQLALVFGSAATHSERPASDLDLAILADRTLDTERRTRLIEDVTMIAGRPVDLVDLRTAGIPVARSAVLGGRLLFCRDRDVYAALASRLLVDSADFLPYRQRALKARREAWLR